ncbi:hypothetical protein [Gracilibacillus dipsosauri]|jgi:hypothetical protein|uniref:hypothetical protein n=1 Tax=Gracilibacillus dipsosauri TaxID=178340 RepID=UPI00240962C9
MSKEIKGKTSSGFDYIISEKRIENYELIEVISEVDENPLLLPKTVNLLLGKEQANKLKDHLRDEEGLVSSGRLSDEIMEIFNNQSETKNS